MKSTLILPLLLVGHSLHAMEFLHKKISNLSLTSYAPIQDNKEKNPAKDKAVAYFRKKNPSYKDEPYNVIKENIIAILANKKLHLESRMALLCHVHFYEIYQKTIPEIHDALNVATSENTKKDYMRVAKKFNYDAVIPYLLVTDKSTYQEIRRLINNIVYCQYDNHHDFTSLETICKQCTPAAEGLWEYVLLYVAHRRPNPEYPRALEMQKKLVQKIVHTYHPDLNAKSNDGWTALLYSVHNGNTELTKFLIASGADIRIPNSKGYTPLMIAITKKNKPAIPLLADKDSINHEANNGETALSLALKTNDIPTIELLLNLGASHRITYFIR